MEEAVRVRIAKQHVVHEGNHSFAIVLEEAALRYRIGSPEVMAGQLGHLLTAAASFPSVSLGIIPLTADRSRIWPVEGFFLARRDHKPPARTTRYAFKVSKLADMTVQASFQHMIGEALDVELDGEVFSMEVLDWAAILKTSDELSARAQGLSQDEINQLYNRHRDPANEIYNYFLDEHDGQVIAGQWLPFAVLGMGYGGESYEEIDNDGLLLLDLRRADGGRAPVLWVRDGEVTEVGGSLADLAITPAAS